MALRYRGSSFCAVTENLVSGKEARESQGSNDDRTTEAFGRTRVKDGTENAEAAGPEASLPVVLVVSFLAICGSRIAHKSLLVISSESRSH